MVSNITTTLGSPISTSATAIATDAVLFSDSGRGVLAATGHALIVIMKIVPSFLVWLAAFATFTLPAWLFTGLSTSLTFTVNATTL